jgi:hypothetical protein
LTDEGAPLGVGAGVVAVEVETGFTDGDDAWMIDEGFQLCSEPVIPALCFMGMEADCGPYVGIFFGEGKGTPIGFWRSTDGDESLDACSVRSIDDGVEIGGELSGVEVDVSVNDHECSSSSISHHPYHSLPRLT